MDKQGLIDNIQKLVDMSGSKSNGEACRIQLSEVVTEMDSIKGQISNLSIDGDALYYNEEEKLRDRQLEVQIQKRIRQDRTELEHFQKELDEVKKEEEKLNQNLSLRSKDLSLEVIKNAEQKIKETLDTTIKEHYETIIAKEQERMATDDKNNKEIENKRQEVQKKMLELTEEIDSLEKTINFNEQILKEIRQNLSDDRNYIDKARRQVDIARKESLEARLKELEEEQKEIVNDPVVLGDRAKEALLKGENLTALNKVREIARQVGELPYMQVANDESLAIEDVRLTKDRENFFMDIKGKKYNLADSRGIDKRISFLENCIGRWEKEIDTYQKEVTSIDLDEKYPVSTDISDISELIDTLENEVNSYILNIDACDNKDLNKKVELQASLNYKSELLNKYKIILDSYKKSLVSIMDESKQLAQIIRKLNENVASAKEEIEALNNSKLVFDTEIIDVLEKESDFAKLNDLTKKIMAIKHRRKFAEMPSDVLQKFEHDLGFDVTPDEIKNDEKQQSFETVLTEDANANLENKPHFENNSEPKITPSFEENKNLTDAQINPAEQLASVEVRPNDLNQLQGNNEQSINSSLENASITIKPAFGLEKEQVEQKESVSIDDTINSISSQLSKDSGVTNTALNTESNVNQQNGFGEATNLSSLFTASTETLKPQQDKELTRVVGQERIDTTPTPDLTKPNVQEQALSQNNIFDFSSYNNNGLETEVTQVDNQELKRVA